MIGIGVLDFPLTADAAMIPQSTATSHAALNRIPD